MATFSHGSQLRGFLWKTPRSNLAKLYPGISRAVMVRSHERHERTNLLTNTKRKVSSRLPCMSCDYPPALPIGYNIRIWVNPFSANLSKGSETVALVRSSCSFGLLSRPFFDAHRCHWLGNPSNRALAISNQRPPRKSSACARPRTPRVQRQQSTAQFSCREVSDKIFIRPQCHQIRHLLFGQEHIHTGAGWQPEQAFLDVPTK